jgi:hypothetical protein
MKWVLKAKQLPFYPRKTGLVPIVQGVGVSKGRSGRMRITSSPRDSITASVQALASRYTANNLPTAFFQLCLIWRPRPDVGYCVSIRRRTGSDNYVINCINVKTKCSGIIRTQHKTGMFTAFCVLVPRISSTETVHYLRLSIFYCLQLI